MSIEILNQGYETDLSPWSITGTKIVRSSSSPLVGSWSMRCGDSTAADSIAQLASPPIPAYAGGFSSRRGFRAWGTMQFKSAVNPTGGTPEIIALYGAANRCGLYMKAGGSQLAILSGVRSSLPTNETLGSSIGTTQKLIEWEYAEEKDEGIYMRVWVDGTLDITHRVATKAITIGTTVPDPYPGLYFFQRGVSAGGKCTWEYRVDSEKIRIGQDAS